MERNLYYKIFSTPTVVLLNAQDKYNIYEDNLRRNHILDGTPIMHLTS